MVARALEGAERRGHVRPVRGGGCRRCRAVPRGPDQPGFARKVRELVAVHRRHRGPHGRSLDRRGCAHGLHGDLASSGNDRLLQVRGGAPGTRARTSCSRARSSRSRACGRAGMRSVWRARAGWSATWRSEDQGEIGPVRVPTVPAAVIFDLVIGDPSRRPGADEGYAACIAASADCPRGAGRGQHRRGAEALGTRARDAGRCRTWAVRDGELVVGASGRERRR